MSVRYEKGMPWWVAHLASGRKIPAKSMLQDFGINDPPIPIKWLVQWMGLTLVEKPFDRLGKRACALEIRFKRTSRGTTAEGAIFVASDMPEHRQRFAVAHALAHLFLHARAGLKEGGEGPAILMDHFEGEVEPFLLPPSQTFCGSDVPIRVYRKDDVYFNGSPEEIKANGYAAKLLMPGWIVRRYRSMGIDQMARLMRVSPRAMGIRYGKMLGLDYSDEIYSWAAWSEYHPSPPSPSEVSSTIFNMMLYPVLACVLFLLMFGVVLFTLM